MPTRWRCGATGVVGALSAFYHDAMDFSDAEHRHQLQPPRRQDADDRRHGLQYNTGMPFMYPDNDLDYAANFMRMMFGNPVREYTRTRCWFARSTSSSSCTPTTSRTLRPRPCVWPVRRGANPFACIAAGIACLWGPAHGGANEAACRCWRRSATFARRRVHQARQGQNDSFKLMGFGHRVTRTSIRAPS